ncbi:MAG: hypothetical protein AAF528_00020 [Cyanobacteria bacterium P01_C01_bin.121]
MDPISSFTENHFGKLDKTTQALYFMPVLIILLAGVTISIVEDDSFRIQIIWAATSFAIVGWIAAVGRHGYRLLGRERRLKEQENQLSIANSRISSLNKQLSKRSQRISDGLNSIKEQLGTLNQQLYLLTNEGKLLENDKDNLQDELRDIIDEIDNHIARFREIGQDIDVGSGMLERPKSRFEGLL